MALWAGSWISQACGAPFGPGPPHKRWFAVPKRQADGHTRYDASKEHHSSGCASAARYDHYIVLVLALICLTIGDCESSHVGLARHGTSHGEASPTLKPRIPGATQLRLRVTDAEGIWLTQHLVFAVTSHLLSQNKKAPSFKICSSRTSKQLGGVRSGFFDCSKFTPGVLPNQCFSAGGADVAFT